MKGLAPHTSLIFEAISKLECIKPYVLVGGTALSLQIGNRESEDLHEMMGLALKYSGHRLKSKNLIAMLTRSSRFVKEKHFASLNPIYDISPMDIERRIISELSKNVSS